jgi:uncharacterized protein (UPF0332 family)
MKEEAVGFWSRALKAIRSAEILLPTDTDSSSSRAYYAAFYAVSALFALEDKTFSKHSALESAVHKDLVKSGRWSKELGEDYSGLQGIRITGDYGVLEHVSERNAEEAIKAARRILRAVGKEHPNIFAYPGVI